VKQGGQTCTTTTTTTQPPYVYYVASRCDDPLIEQYFRTTGSYTAGESVSYNGYCWEIQSLTGISGVDAVSAYINCAACNGSNPTTTTTTTTTSSTTTTTTLAGVQFGVSINTKYATDYLACTGTVTGVVYQKAEFGNTPTVGAQLYTSATTGSGTEWTPSAGIGLYIMQFGGSTKWSVLVGNTGIINTVTSCVGVSTTTTTTTLPAIIVTATPSCDGSGFNGQGRVTANFSGGTGSYTWAALGTSEANAIACVNNSGCSERFTVVGSSSFAWTSLANGPYYVAVLDNNGSLGLSGLATVSCNATTTTTTTTTSSSTTSSTTTTTTLAGVQFGVSITTKYATDFLACTGTVTGVVYQKAEFGNTPTVGAQLYTSSTTGSGTEWTPSAGIGLYLIQFGGSDKWSVLVGTTGIINTVTSCVGVSTTTTTTTFPPVTANISSVCTGITQTITVDTFGGGSGTYFASTTTYGDPVSAAAGAVTSVSGSRSYSTQPNGTRYVYVTSTGGAPVVKQGGQTCTTTTSTTTTTTEAPTTSTTTTTTTQPIVNYYVATRCDNPLLEQYFNTTGSYSVGESVRYNGYCWEIQSIAELSGVVADSAYINCAACNGAFPTTSTTTTTTTSAPPAYDFYNADVYDCNDCSASIDTILVAFDAGTNVTLNRWYNAQAGPDGNSYRVTSVGNAGIAYLLALPSYNSCALACFV
jgi:hypothetical protein